MNGMREILSVAMLASMAACGGGGSPPIAATSGAVSAPQTSATSSSSPSAALDQSTSPATLTVRIPDIGMDHAFTLAGDSLQNATFNGAPIGNLVDISGNGSTNFAIKSDNNGQDVLVYDASGLSYSAYGIWSHSDATGKVAAVGAVLVGIATPAADMAGLKGLASYTGGVVATGSSGAGNLNLTGVFSAAVNFDNFQVGFNSNLYTAQTSGALQKWGGINGFATITPGTSAFAGTTSSWGSADQLNGTMSGSFFGPGAKEIGGTFSAVGGKTSLVGAFGGPLSPPQPSSGSGFGVFTGSMVSSDTLASSLPTGTLAPTGALSGSFSGPSTSTQGTFGTPSSAMVAAFGSTVKPR